VPTELRFFNFTFSNAAGLQRQGILITKGQQKPVFGKFGYLSERLLKMNVCLASARKGFSNPI